MNIQKGFYPIGVESIYYEKSQIDSTPCSIIVLHGAGKSDITRMFALRRCLFERGILTLALDFSWHGQSTHNEPGSIKKRILEARELMNIFLDTKENIQVIGFSMSWEVVIRLTEYFDIQNIILFAPGIYHKDVIDIPFWERFSEMIRRNESWKNHDMNRILENYEGNIILVIPEHDNVIPEWVNEEIMSVAPRAYKKRITIDWAPHLLGKWLNENPEKVSTVIDQINIIDDNVKNVCWIMYNI